MKMKEFWGSLAFYKRAILIALPVMAQALIQNLVSLVDNFMVSGLGDVKMSGVNIAGQILFLFMIFLNTLCMGGGIFLTQFFGAKQNFGMCQAFKFKLFSGFAAVIVYFVVCWIFPRLCLSFLVRGNLQAEAILDQGEKYLFMMGFCGIPMIICYAIGSSLKEIGRVKIPLIVGTISTFVNVAFNWIFIYGNLGAPRLEVRGAALATIIAKSVETICYVIYCARVKPKFICAISEFFKLDFSLFGEIFKKCLMMLFSEMVWAIAETITVALYNGRGGADVVAGMAASFAISNLFFVSFGGVTTATGVILGSTLGAGNLEEAKRNSRWLLSGGAVFGFVMLLAGFATIPLVDVVFSNLSETARAITRLMVFVQALYMPAWVFINVQFAISRAGGDTIMGMLVDGIGNLGIVIPGMFFMAFCTPMGPVAMYAIIKAVEFPKIAIAHFWLRKERWLKNLASAEGARS